MRKFVPVLVCFMLMSCTTPQPSALQPVSAADPAGAASVAGAFPVMMPDPVGATEHFTEAERELMRAELQLDALRGSAVAARVNEMRFRSDVSVLQAEAEAELERQLEIIEGKSAPQNIENVSQ